jgi:excinuclease ABC subunit C
VLHLVQQIRDESHRFAVTFHRKRREIRDRQNPLLDIPGIGKLTSKRLVSHFGSVRAVSQADAAALSAVVNPKQVHAILEFFRNQQSAS